MKKSIGTLMCVLLAVLISVGSAPSVGAALAPLMVGDADYDYQITINDATRIQRHLAGFQRLDRWYGDELYEAICDADGDGSMTILDATCIQRYLAALPCHFVEREIWDYYVGDSGHHSTAEIKSKSYVSTETAYVGVPVTFTARATWGAAPRALSVKIDGVTVEERAVSGRQPFAYTCAFDAEGEHEVLMKLECRYGVTESCVHHVVVRSLPGDGAPVIMGAAFFDQTRMRSGDGVLTVTAAGGTGPYEYSYVLYTDMAAPTGAGNDDPEPTEMPPDEPQPGGTISTGWIAENTIDVVDTLGMSGISPDGYGMPEIRVQITVRDASGRESAPVTVCYQFYELVA